MDKQIILLVEDNPDDVELTLRVLNTHHIANEVLVARDGVEALDILYGTPGHPAGRMPSVVLLDLKLPKLDGLEVLRRIRSEPATARLPVVVMTTSREERDIVSSYELGANSYVQKPVGFEAFAEAVRFLGLYWLLLNVPAGQ
ncbi:MAG: response regulator [Holophaga sp.]|nr:response regulator [Holophaga sp.]